MYDHKELTNSLLQFDWHTNPHHATAKGIRDWDGELPSADPARVTAQIRSLHQFRDKFHNALREELFADTDEMMDLEVGLQYIVSALAELEMLRPWQKNPMHAIGILATAINGLMSPSDDPDSRDKALLKRLQSGVAFLEQARNNLHPAEIPPLWVQIAQSNTGGLRLLLTESLPIFAQQTCRSDEIGAASTLMVAALDSYSRFLSDIENEAHGTYACGPEYFEVMLKQVYMVNMSVDDLLTFGRDKVSEFEAALVNQAREIDAEKSWPELLAETKTNHPTSDKLIAAYGAEKDRAAAFIRDRDLVSIPEGELCTMTETPIYARPTTPLGSMNTTRPYTPGLHSFFNITPVDTTAPSKRQEQHLRDSNYAFIKSIAFHEVIPGHHLQACKHKQQASYFRKNFSNTILIEGWGLYTEDLMAESGYLADPLLNLIRLKNALWRAARVVIDVGLHTQNMPFNEAVSLLQDKIRQEPHMAVGEARRYTVGPTYPSSYMLGREQIHSLREACRAHWGTDFSLKRFHDELLSYGSMPVALIRRQMLSD